LRHLILKENSIGMDSSGIATLCDALKVNCTITRVDLRNNRISNVGARCIAQMLLHNTKITQLDLSWNDFGYDGGIQILEGLKHNTVLVDCQLSGSKCNEDTVHEIALLLGRNRTAAAHKVGAPSANPSICGAYGVDPSMSPARARDLSMFSRSRPCSALASPCKTSSSLATPVSIMHTPRSTHTKARLQKKQREVFLPDNHFFGKVSDHLDNLEVEVLHHKQATADTEARERNAMLNFNDREHTFKVEIAVHKGKIASNTAAKKSLQQEIVRKKESLASAQDEHEQSIQENIGAKQRAQKEEQKLQNELRDLNHTNHSLQSALAVNTDELNNVRAENERLRGQMASFQREVHNMSVLLDGLSE